MWMMETVSTDTDFYVDYKFISFESSRYYYHPNISQTSEGNFVIEASIFLRFNRRLGRQSQSVHKLLHEIDEAYNSSNLANQMINTQAPLLMNSSEH